MKQVQLIQRYWTHAKNLFQRLTVPQWHSCPMMPRPRWAFASVLVGDKVYHFGGLSEIQLDAEAISAVDTFDYVEEQWSTVSPMATGRHSLAAARLGDLIFVCGGTTDGWTALKSCDIYDPSHDTWNVAAVDMIHGRVDLRMVVFYDVLYILGGSEDGTVHDTIEFYNPATNTFNLLTEKSPNTKYHFSAVAIEFK